MSDKKEQKKDSKKSDEQGEQSEKVENIVAFSVIGVLILVFLFMWYGGFGFFDKEGPTEPVVTTDISGEPGKGERNAPITIVEYSDFECPFCGKWYREVYPLIKEAYIDTGKARIVFKQFPLTKIHRNAMDAAIASECAYQQGEEKFWEYHNLLFERQPALEDENLKSYAKEIGLNALQFDLCLSNRNPEWEVSGDFSEGIESGVTGTPAFIIGKTGFDFKGELLVGAQPFGRFSEIISRYE